MPAIVATLDAKSYSNVPPFSGITWQNDDELTYLTTGDGTKFEIQSFSLNARRIRTVLKNAVSVRSFSISKNGQGLIYNLDDQVTPVLNAANRLKGVVVGDQSLTELASDGKVTFPVRRASAILWRFGRSSPSRISTKPGEVYGSGSISPNGRYAVFPVIVGLESAPAQWQALFTNSGADGIWSYRLFDLASGTSRTLVKAPLLSGVGLTVVWSSDSKSVTVQSVASFKDDHLSATPSIVRVGIDDGNAETLITGPFCLNPEAAERGEAAIGRASGLHSTTACGPITESPQSAVQKPVTLWTEDIYPRIEFRQSLQDWPKAWFIPASQSPASLLLDPNRQFADLDIGRVSEMTWNVRGQNIYGAIYLPPNFHEGGKYPLVVQIRSYRRGEFYFDGYLPSGGAARALAANGMIVLQLGLVGLGGTTEGDDNLRVLEQIFDDLNRKGWIDPKNIGIWAFSRSGFAARYAIAFSKYRLGAALLTDSQEGGYLDYATSAGTWGRGLLPGFYERMYGSIPTGPGLVNWATKSPTMNFDRWHTPVLEFRLGSGFSLEEGWESLNMLRRLGKPVELIWLPDAAHVVTRPSDRIAVQQTGVDWFRFWLKGEIDDRPSAQDEYVRWNVLKGLQIDDIRRAGNLAP